MPELGKLAELVRIPLRWWAGLAVVSGLLLLLPSETLARMRLDKLVEQFGAYLGGLFLLSVAFSVVGLISVLAEQVAAARQRRSTKRALRARVADFDEPERSIVREFTLQGAKTVRMPIEDASVARLLGDGVLQVVGPAERLVFGTIVPLALTLDARLLLSSDLLGIPNVKDAASKERLMGARPSFVRQIEEFDRWKRGLY